MKAIRFAMSVLLLLLARPEVALAQRPYIGWNEKTVESYPGGPGGQYGQIVVPATAYYILKLSQTGTLIQNLQLSIDSNAYRQGYVIFLTKGSHTMAATGYIDFKGVPGTQSCVNATLYDFSGRLLATDSYCAKLPHNELFATATPQPGPGACWQLRLTQKWGLGGNFLGVVGSIADPRFAIIRAWNPWQPAATWTNSTATWSRYTNQSATLPSPATVVLCFSCPPTPNISLVLQGYDHLGNTQPTWKKTLLLDASAFPGCTQPRLVTLGGTPFVENGVFSAHAGKLYRSFWSPTSGWQKETIDTWGLPVATQSLISGQQRVFGVLEDGRVFNAYQTGPGGAGSATFAPLQNQPANLKIHPLSLVLGGTVDVNEGLFGVDTQGRLVRTFWQGNSWQWEVIDTWGYQIVPGSLISGPHRVIGVLTDGQPFNTYRIGSGGLGSSLFGILGNLPAGVAKIVPTSLAFVGSPYDDSGFLAVDTLNQLVRGYWYNNTWNWELIDTGGNAVSPDSLISGPASVFGVLADGKVFQARKTGSGGPGSLTFALLENQPAQQRIVPHSLAVGGTLGQNDGLFGLTVEGRLVHAVWNGQWTWETVNTWGHTVAPGSLIPGYWRVYGVLPDGQAFNTYKTAPSGLGTTLFGLLP